MNVTAVAESTRVPEKLANQQPLSLAVSCMSRVGRSSDFRASAGPAFSSRRQLTTVIGADARQWPKDWANLLPLGHSGGAVPDFHRSSLFVGPSSKKGPTTNARCKKENLSQRREVVNSGAARRTRSHAPRGNARLRRPASAKQNLVSVNRLRSIEGTKRPRCPLRRRAS
jgi:hypothetical protein